MEDLNARFQFSPEKIVFEKFEDETVLISLETGSYFSFLGSAGDIWTLLNRGYSIKEIQEVYSIENNKVFSDELLNFVNQLIENNLIYKRESKPEPLDEVSVGIYSTPIIETYTDMQDLILLDPVHDVNEKAWPNTSENKNV